MLEERSVPIYYQETGGNKHDPDEIDAEWSERFASTRPRLAVR